LKLTAAQKTWTRIRPLFKREFATTSDDKLIVDGLANLSHRQGENPRRFFSRLEKLCNVLHENFASFRIKPTRPAQLGDGHYSEDALTQYGNDSVEAYNQFLFTQIFKAAAPENVRKLLSHKDQTRLTVDEAYQTFFTEHRVEQDKRQPTAINVHAVEDQQTSETITMDPNVAAFRPQHPPQQQFRQQQGGNRGNCARGQGNYRGNSNTNRLSQNQGKECRKRINDKKPCVNGKGQLYWPKINNIDTHNAQATNSDSIVKLGRFFNPEPYESPHEGSQCHSTADFKFVYYFHRNVQ
jgi:hypothetical protein